MPTSRDLPDTSAQGTRTVHESSKGRDNAFATLIGVAFLVPLRREFSMPWFRIVARIGGVGGQEESYEPDFSDMFTFDTDKKTKRPGELFLFVNDAVIGWSPLYDVFYKHNDGEVKVLITGK